MRRKIVAGLLAMVLLFGGCTSKNRSDVETAGHASSTEQGSTTIFDAGTTTTATAGSKGETVVTQPSQGSYNPGEIQTPQNPPNSQGGTGEELVGDWIVNCGDYVNLRSGASSGTDIICQINAGDAVTLLAWQERYAYVEYKGQCGYVMASYLKPKKLTALSVVEWTDCYTYEQMQTDLAAIATQYPDKVALDVIGKSENGLDIPVLRLGNVSASKHVLFQGAIHAREHMTTWLLMAMTDYWAAQDASRYGDVCYHIIPMLNPDGVKISQGGVLPAELEAIYQKDLASGYTFASRSDYARLWKANGKGVDLNRNFDAGWDMTLGRGRPSSERYKGTAAFCASEAAALRDYTLRYDFAVTISYHSNGSIIYYEYGDHPANADCEKLAQAAKNVTGYPLIGSGGVDGAGYKDWALDVLGIPSLTLEIGCESSPLALRESYSILARNLDVLPTVGQWASEQ